jgi:hypothetical protein
MTGRHHSDLSSPVTSNQTAVGPIGLQFAHPALKRVVLVWLCVPVPGVPKSLQQRSDATIVVCAAAAHAATAAAVTSMAA